MTDMELVRLSCNMNLETAAALKAIKDRLPENRSSYTEAVRTAVSLATYLYDEESSGRVIITQNADGSDKRELIII